MTEAWFDAHLDLSYVALGGRDMYAPPGMAGGDNQPAAVTFPSLAVGNVRWALGTIFAEVGSPQLAWGFKDYEDRETAHQSGVMQLEMYGRWEREGLIRIVRTAADLDGTDDGQLRVILFMEGADPIRKAEEAGWWFERGVRVVGLSWARGSRFAGGDGAGAQGPGLSDEGRDLVKVLDGLGVVHDLTHLNDRSAEDLLSAGGRSVIASHSACRSLMDGKRERHISDALIREVGRRGGVIGLPLYTKFLTMSAERATLGETTAHIARQAELMGRRDGVGLGSDMDGGFSAAELTAGINRPADLPKLAGALARRGWSAGEVEGWRKENWMRFFRRVLAQE